MTEKKQDAGTTKAESQDPGMFGVMCDSVYTSMVTLNNTLEEFFSFKDELLTHNLPPKLLVNLTLLSSKLFRSYSDLCTPVSELSRMVRLHSTPWEEKTEGLKKIRTDYENMQRRLNIALKKIEMMSAEEERIKHERRLSNWERLYTKVMEVKSHGRRWKFRIEPLKKKLERDGYNPYLSDSSESSGEEGDVDDELRQLNSPFEGSEDEFRELGSNSDSESFRESSRKSGSSQKRVHFLDGDEFDIGHGGQLVSPVETPIEAPPPVETAEASTSTEEPSYDNYLLLQVYRPKGLLSGKEVCCSFSLGDQFCSSKPFPSKQEPGTLLTNQSFHFELSQDSARSLPPLCQEPLNSVSVSKLAVAVYPRNLAGEMSAHMTLPLKELTVTEEPTIVVPPQSIEEEFEIKWEEISSSVHAFPVEYPLNVNSSKVDEMVDEGEIPVIPIVCHRVKVLKHEQMHCGTDTAPWEELLLELGYHLLPDTQSQAVSAINFDLPAEEAAAPLEEDEEDDHVTLTQEQMAEITLKHAEEMKKLQAEYEKRLTALSKSISRVKAEKAKQIEELEKALIEAEQSKGRKGRSIAEIQSLLARKKKLKTTHGLPEWGKDLPHDFFERLELFADESIRKQEELTQKIKLEVSQACERQLATQHKLAPSFRTDIDTTTEDVSLPALFMPSSCTKNLVYTPRAHSYFHPPGSSETRISQPPSIFKLPALHTNHLSTLNLFELSQQFSQSGPRWLKESPHPSPQYTPAPPPSANDSFHHYSNN